MDHDKELIDLLLDLSTKGQIAVNNQAQLAYPINFSKSAKTLITTHIIMKDGEAFDHALYASADELMIPFVLANQNPGNASFDFLARTMIRNVCDYVVTDVLESKFGKSMMESIANESYRY